MANMQIEIYPNNVAVLFVDGKESEATCANSFAVVKWIETFLDSLPKRNMCSVVGWMNLKGQVVKNEQPN
jgi:hypothetical protein